MKRPGKAKLAARTTETPKLQTGAERSARPSERRTTRKPTHEPRRESKPATAKPWAHPYKLPTHQWYLAEWLTDRSIKPENLIWIRGNRALVRPGASKRVQPQPPEGDEAVCVWSEQRYREEVEQFLKVDREMQARLIARARHGKSGARPLAWKARDNLTELFTLANNGNKTAAEQLAEILRGAVIQLTELAKTKPELIRPIARNSWKWPVMKSRHPLLCDEHQNFLNVLNLGYDLPFYFDERSGWQFDEWSKIALSLLTYIWAARKEQRSGDLKYGRVGELADALPEFRRGARADDWWEFAEAVFLATYPNPETLPELADLVMLKRRTPSVVREKIVERLQQRFLNFAKP